MDDAIKATKSVHPKAHALTRKESVRDYGTLDWWFDLVVGYAVRDMEEVHVYATSLGMRANSYAEITLEGILERINERPDPHPDYWRCNQAARVQRVQASLLQLIAKRLVRAVQK